MCAQEGEVERERLLFSLFLFSVSLQILQPLFFWLCSFLLIPLSYNIDDEDDNDDDNNDDGNDNADAVVVLFLSVNTILFFDTL